MGFPKTIFRIPSICGDNRRYINNRKKKETKTKTKRQKTKQQVWLATGQKTDQLFNRSRYPQRLNSDKLIVDAATRTPSECAETFPNIMPLLTADELIAAYMLAAQNSYPAECGSTIPRTKATRTIISRTPHNSHSEISYLQLHRSLGTRINSSTICLRYRYRLEKQDYRWE